MLAMTPFSCMALSFFKDLQTSFIATFDSLNCFEALKKNPVQLSFSVLLRHESSILQSHTSCKTHYMLHLFQKKVLHTS